MIVLVEMPASEGDEEVGALFPCHLGAAMDFRGSNCCWRGLAGWELNGAADQPSLKRPCTCHSSELNLTFNPGSAVVRAGNAFPMKPLAGPGQPSMLQPRPSQTTFASACNEATQARGSTVAGLHARSCLTLHQDRCFLTKVPRGTKCEIVSFRGDNRNLVM